MVKLLMEINGNIVVVNCDTGQDRTIPGAVGHTPSWTPDGRVIFADNFNPGHIIVCNEDGSNMQAIGGELNLHVVVKPHMANNGTVCWADQDPALGGLPGPIYLMDPNGRNVRQVIPEGFAPCLALSGNWLTFTYQTYSAPGVVDHRQIHRVDTNGGNYRELTSSLDDPDYPDSNASAISPDETQVCVFTGKEDDGTSPPWEWGFRNLALLNAQGGVRRLLTHCIKCTTPESLMAIDPSDCIAADNPAFAPDGLSVLYDRGSVKPQATGTWIISLDGKINKRLHPLVRGAGVYPLTYDRRGGPINLDALVSR